MDARRLFLAANALLWILYGLFCLARPGFLDEAAGIVTRTTTGTTELRAMYGGLQVAIGVIAAAALVRPALEQAAIGTIGTLAAGLFTGRAIGALVDGGLSGYTIGGLLLESSLAFFASRLLR
ncbi:MAG: DUF4345 family protein [Alphaproteobacteria bacterium]